MVQVLVQTNIWRGAESDTDVPEVVGTGVST
jgi:hypothetical protein